MSVSSLVLSAIIVVIDLDKNADNTNHSGNAVYGRRLLIDEIFSAPTP